MKCGHCGETGEHRAECPAARTEHVVERIEGFVQVPNATVRDSALSFRATGVLVFMLSHRTGWEASARWLEGQRSEGEAAIRAALMELEAAGYAQKLVVREAGKFARHVWTWRVRPVPPEHRTNATGWRKDDAVDPPPRPGKPVPGKPVPGKPVPGKPVPGNPGTQNTIGTEYNQTEKYPDSHLARPEHSKMEPAEAELFLLSEEQKGDSPEERIWKLFPRKEDKGHGIPAIRGALEKLPFAALEAAVRSFAADVKAKGTPKKMIPYPATWLHGERWKEQKITNTTDGQSDDW